MRRPGPAGSPARPLEVRSTPETASGGFPWAAGFRWGETVLVVIGLSLLGEVFFGLASTRISQARDERALLEEERELVARPSTSGPLATGASKPASSGSAALCRIEIPSVGISAVVREGDDEATLAVAVGHVRGTARPGEAGNAVLAGHRDSFFRGLRRIQRGDRIWIRSPGKHVEYRVGSTEIVGPEETHVLASTADDRLTLVTCYPFGFIGRAPKRFIVRATPIVDGED